METPNKLPHEAHLALTAIMHGAAYQDCMDKLQNTTFYRHEPKQLMKRLEKPLEDFVNKNIDICFGDHHALFHLMDDIKKVTQEVANMRMAQQSLLAAVLDLIKERGDWVAARLEIKETDSETIDEWNERQELISYISALPINDFRELKKRIIK